MRIRLAMVTGLTAGLIAAASVVAQDTMQPVRPTPKTSTVRPTTPNTNRPPAKREYNVTVDGQPVESPRRRSFTQRDEQRRAENQRQRRDRRVKAEIDSLDADLQHAGADWQIVIEYEVEIEGRVDNDVYLLVLELFEDERPVVDENGAPLVMEIEMLQPTDRDDDELKFEDRFSATVPKVWVLDDDELELRAKLVRAGDGLIFDDEDESVDQDRGRGIGIGIGIGWGIGCGLGVGPVIGF